MKKSFVLIATVCAACILLFAGCNMLNNNNNNNNNNNSGTTTWTAKDYSAAAGSGNLLSSLWYDATVPTALAKDSDGNMNVGWKDYNNYWKDVLIDSGNTNKKAAKGGYSKSKYAGTITDATYTAEYSNREVILNRVYNKTSGEYVADPNYWDISALKAEFGVSD